MGTHRVLLGCYLGLSRLGAVHFAALACAALGSLGSFLLVALGLDGLSALKPVGVMGLTVFIPMSRLAFRRSVWRATSKGRGDRGPAKIFEAARPIAVARVSCSGASDMRDHSPLHLQALMKLLVPATIAVLFSPIVSAAPQEILVVSPASGPGEFRTIQAAIDFALPGDVVDVRDGTYDGFHISRPVTVLFEEGVWVEGTSTIQGVHDERPVALAGYATLGPLEVDHCTAPIVLNGLGIRGPQHGLALNVVSDVRAWDVSVLTDGSSGIAALVMLSSRIDASRCRFNAGSGDRHGDGKPAVMGLDSFVHGTKCVFQGGSGGGGLLGESTIPGDGDVALYFDLGSGSRLVECDVFGGSGGTIDFGPTGTGATALLATSGRHEAWATGFVQGGGAGSAPAIRVFGSGQFDDSVQLPYIDIDNFAPLGPVLTIRRAGRAGFRAWLVEGNVSPPTAISGSRIDRLVDSTVAFIPLSLLRGAVQLWTRPARSVPGEVQGFQLLTRDGFAGYDLSNSIVLVTRP